MIKRTPKTCTVLFALLLLGSLCAFVSSAHAQEDKQRIKLIKGIGPGKEVDDGLYRVRIAGGGSALVHKDGPVPAAAQGQDNAISRRGLYAGSLPPVCRSDKNTWQVLYTYAPDATYQMPTRIEDIRSKIMEANYHLAYEGRISGGDRRFRMVCNIDSHIDVKSCGQAQVNNVSGIITNGKTAYDAADACQRAGYNLDQHKYLIIQEGGDHTGVGYFWNDNRLGSDNFNNKYASAAIIPTNEHYFTPDRILHEIIHTLGAVYSASAPLADGQMIEGTPPHATGGLHCYDGLDIMCYNDSSASSGNYSTSYCLSPVQVLDCGKDDYFNPAPTLNNYLATHFNTANSPFLSPLRIDDLPVPGDGRIVTPTYTSGPILKSFKKRSTGLLISHTHKLWLAPDEESVIESQLTNRKRILHRPKICLNIPVGVLIIKTNPISAPQNGDRVCLSKTRLPKGRILSLLVTVKNKTIPGTPAIISSDNYFKNQKRVKHYLFDSVIGLGTNGE